MTTRKQKQEPIIEDTPIIPQQEGIVIDVSNIVIPPPVKPSLKERLLGKSDEEPSRKTVPVKKKGSKVTVDVDRTVTVFRSVLPMTLAGLFAMQSKRWFKDPYKPCAPDREEVAEILLPIFNFISRRIEISGKITQDAEDLAACIFASITLTIRMLMTAQEIREYGQQLTPTERIRDNATDTTKDVINTVYNNRQQRRNASKDSVPEGDTAYGHYPDQSKLSASGIGADDPGSNGHADNGPVDHVASERAKVADLLRRDTFGRRQMGLAPRIFRDDDRTTD